MTNYNIALQGTQLQGSQNKTTSQVLDFSFIEALPTENEIVLALLELDFKKRNKVEAAAKIVRRILIDQHKTHTLSGKEVGIEREGKKYIFNTYPELAEYCELRHLSRDQMGRIVRALEDTELLESIQPFAHYWGEYTPRTFRENPNNHTKAYRINLELLNEYLDLTAEPQSTNIGHHRSYTDYTHDCASFAQSLKETNNQSKYSFKEREKSKNISLERKKTQKDKADSKDNYNSINGYGLQNTTVSEQTHYSEAQNCNESQELGVWKSEEERSLFGKEFYVMAQNCSAVKNPRAYTATVIQRIDRGEPESIDTLQLWRDGATEQELFFQFVETPHPQRKQSNQSNSSNSRSKGTPNQSNVLSEWQIKPENTDLIEQGCEVGEPYPQFLKWAVERCQRSGETRQQTKLRLLTQFDFNPTAPKELWRDYKQFLDNQYQELQNNESKGLPYYAPEELKLTPEVPEERAKEASVAINRKLLGEYQLVQNMRELVEAESTPQPCLVKESSVSGIYHQAEIPNLWESSDIHLSSTVEVLSDSEISDQSDDDGKAGEENVVLPEVPEWLSPSAIAISLQKHQTANRKGFKPYLTLINASLKRGDDAHKRAILDIVETLSEEDQRQIKIPVISEPEPVQLDKPEPISQQQDEVDPSWLETIAQMIQQMACTPYEEFIIDAINQALGEVCEEMQSQILKLARDALSLNALNQIEVAF